MPAKCTLPKGTRDFLPAEMARRNHIFDTIRHVFTTFGYEPIETPALENLSTLLGKYGEEGDKLLFKVLNSGDFTQGVDLHEEDYRKLSAAICDRGLRYDLTVPFARFVTMHRDQIALPFRRYQLQPVWRADRPQKGRYREFYQCDADTIGSDSLLNELELVQMMDQVFQHLGIEVTIKLNNRKILSGLALLAHAPDKVTDITVAIDKLDKIGPDGVRAELQARGLSEDQIAALAPVFQLQGTPQAKIERLQQLFQGDDTGLKGVDEARTLLGLIGHAHIANPIDLDLTLARGLNYYTGTIFEVKAHHVQIGSICGGGRYDNLTGIFGSPGLSGVGISFGADRIYDVLTELDLFPATLGQAATAMLVNFGHNELPYCIQAAQLMRQAGISTIIYPDPAKVKKQMEYANRKGIPFVVFVGEEEIASRTLTVKDMATGSQRTVALDHIQEAFL